MSTQNSPSTASDSKKSRPLWGKNPPASSLEECVNYLDQAYRLGGTHGSWDVLTRAVGTSTFNSSSFQRRVYSVRNFGLWDLDGKEKTYTITELGEEITSPDSADSRVVAIQAAFRKVEFLATIWDFFKGKALPSEEFLPNAIARSCGVPNELKDEWAAYFVQAATFAQIFEDRPNGRYITLGYTPRPVSYVDTTNFLTAVKEEERPQPVQGTSFAPPVIVGDNSAAIDSLVVLLKGGMRFQKKAGESYALIYIPDNLKDGEAEKIRSLLKAADTLLEGMTE